MASIFDNGPSGVDIPDLREYLSYRSKWPSGMRQTEPRDYPAYGRKIPKPKSWEGGYDVYEGVGEVFDWYRGGVTDELQVKPTDFVKEALIQRGINGVTPERDMDTVAAWNRFKKEQYQRRGTGDWQMPMEKGAWGIVDPDPSGAHYSSPVEDWMLEKTDILDPREMLAEAEAMESQGSAEGIPLTEATYGQEAHMRQRERDAANRKFMEKINQQMALDPYGANKVAIEDMPQRVTNASVVQRPKFRGNY